MGSSRYYRFACGTRAPNFWYDETSRRLGVHVSLLGLVDGVPAVFAARLLRASLLLEWKPAVIRGQSMGFMNSLSCSCVVGWEWQALQMSWNSECSKTNTKQRTTQRKRLFWTKNHRCVKMSFAVFEASVRGFRIEVPVFSRIDREVHGGGTVEARIRLQKLKNTFSTFWIAGKLAIFEIDFSRTSNKN